MPSTPINQSTKSPIGVLAEPLSVEGIDDSDLAGHVPREILITGTRIVIPYWLGPQPNDRLCVIKRQNGVEETIYNEKYETPLPDKELHFNLTPTHLAVDGIMFLYYVLWKGDGGNNDRSPDRQLTIDHTPPLTFPELVAVGATLWGYWNNNTNPPLTSGGTLKVPSLINIALPGDVAVTFWRGYRSLNGSGPEVAEAFGRWQKELADTDIRNGFNQLVPFSKHISSLVDDDSAVFVCQVFRGGKLIAESEKGLVKIDRVTPGKPGPSGLNAQGDKEMGIKFVPKTPRPASTSSGGGINSVVTIDTLAGGFVAKAVLDSGVVNFKFTRSDEEFDRDTVEVQYREKGDPNWINYPDKIALGPIVDRPPTTVLLPFDAKLFAEKATSPGPTVWEFRLDLFKDDGGNADPSDPPIEFITDQTAPVNTKNPLRKIKPTPAPVFVNGTPLPLRTIDKTWIDNNANMNLTVNTTYLWRRDDDVLKVWFISGTQEVLVWDAAVPASGALDIDSTELLKFPNGRVNVVYQWIDWLGNEGEKSASVGLLTLALPVAPSIDKAPLVPKTDPNYATTLYWEDFLNTASPPAPIPLAAIVENSSILNAVTGDEVYLVFTKALDVTVFFETATQQWANANLSFDIDFTDLYPMFADTDDPVDIEIKSVIVRTGLSPDAESPTATFTFDSRVAGVIPPNPPDLENPDLQLPVVTGVSAVPDVIAATDRDKPGTFTVTNALTDPDILPEHEVKCYLGAATVPFATYSPLVAVQNFSVPIPASEMAKLKPPSDTARYTIEITGSGKNVNKSLPKTVVVNQIPIVLPDPTIRIRNQAVRDYIECYGMTSPTSGYVLGLQIAKTPLLPPGTVITAHFEAHSNATGTALISGTDTSAPYTIQAANIPDVAGVGTAANFKAAQPRRGALAWGKYWITAQNGLQSSTPVIKPLDTINNSFQYCDLTLAPV